VEPHFVTIAVKIAAFVAAVAGGWLALT